MAQTPHHHEQNFCLETASLSVRDGVLRADDFDDLYFSAEDGLAETYHVFIDGNNLIERLAATSHLTIAETGFGTGLNFLAVMALYRQCQEEWTTAPAQIDYISFESRPLNRGVMREAHRQFSALDSVSIELCSNLPPRWPGLHRRNFCDGNVRLHLVYGDAGQCLAEADFTADVWFLDGFSPAKNPALWDQSVMQQIARLTQAGGSFATFTAARHVRDSLASAGFDVSKRPGFGRKREMLVGLKAGKWRSSTGNHAGLKTGIIGGGIAGASVAAGLAMRGGFPHIIDANPTLAGGASGNRLALQSPRLAVDHNHFSQLSADCLSYAAWYSDLCEASVQKGVISLDWPEREAIRQEKFRGQLWPDDLMTPVDRVQSSICAGIEMPLGGMYHKWGRVIEPAAFTRALAAPAELHLGFDVTSVTRTSDGYLLFSKDGDSLYFDRLVITAGASLETVNQLLGIDGVSIDITSGQVSQVPSVARLANLATGVSFGGYLTASHNGFHELGASFDRTASRHISGHANIENRDRLPPELASMMPDPADYEARVSLRASAPDRAPVIGCLSEGGLYVLGALGARGLTFAPLLGDLLAAHIMALPMVLDRRIWQALDPFRFRLRKGRR